MTQRDTGGLQRSQIHDLSVGLWHCDVRVFWEKCLPMMSQSQTSSTWLAAGAQPWPLFPATVEAAGSPGCKASLWSLGQEAPFVYPTDCRGCSYPKKASPVRRVICLWLFSVDIMGPSPSWRLMVAAQPKDKCHCKQLQF